MRIVNKFKGLTGKELLAYATSDGDAKEVNDEMMIIIPRTLPFANQAEISTVDEATHVSVQTRFMDNSQLVKI